MINSAILVRGCAVLCTLPPNDLLFGILEALGPNMLCICEVRATVDDINPA